MLPEHANLAYILGTVCANLGGWWKERRYLLRITSYESIASTPGSGFLSLLSSGRRVPVRKDGLWTTNLETI